MAPNEPTTAREWALLYGFKGWRVFPVVAGGKRPLYKGWQRDATTDPELIDRYWRKDPTPNIGIICGEAFVAFDIEADHLPALSSWTRAHGHELPDTPIARTGRGGLHVLTAPFVDGGRALRLDGRRIGELKGRGGFIVACPSRTIGSYAWLRSPEATVVAVAPEWLRGLAESVRRPSESPGGAIGVGRGEARLAALARTVRDGAVGSRNDLLYWAMRRALDDGVPAGVAGSVLGRMARAAGLEEREIEGTVRSATEAAA
jgi:Bifunctional DNA primase/polymerase, N-terminal